MRFFWIILSVCFLSKLAMAQKAPRIGSARPGQSIGAGIVGPGVFQIQSGIDQAEVWSAGSAETTRWNNIIRLGFTDDFEMSTLINYQEIQRDSGGSQRGVSDVHLGFRNRIVAKSDGLIPALAAQIRFKFTSVDEDYSGEEMAPVVIISAVHNLDDVYSLTTNYGANFSGKGEPPTYFGTLNLARGWGENWESFVEAFGNMTSGVGSIFVNGGGAYFLNNDLKLDLSLGWGNNQGNTDFFASAGVSWRAQVF